MNKVFLHVDLDAFFASVEQLDNPEYRGKPVIVGGLPGDRRAVVSTASYEARKFGVHSAMPIFQAAKLCPKGIFVRGRMKRYHEKSEEVMSIFKNYSPDIQQISVDEAFIDLTGTEKLFGAPEKTARRLKAEVFEKTGLTVSVGLASTKYCAKIASGLQKPDGLTIVAPGQEKDFMLSLPITKIWGAGSKTIAKLEAYGMKTSSDIYKRSEKILQSIFGTSAGTFLYNAVRGNAGEDFNANPKTRSISAENTYEYDLTNPDTIETALLSLCHTVMFRSLREKVRSSTVSVKIRYEDFSTVSVQSTSDRYVSSVDDLFERAKKLLEKKRDGRLGIRLLGLAMQNLEDDNSPRQGELFDFGEEKKRKLENAILKAQEKNPALKITKARLLGSTTLLLLAFFAFFPQSLFADTVREKEADGAAGIVFDTSRLPLSDSGKYTSLFNKDFGKDGEQHVEFFAEGYWKSTVTGGLSYSFGFGTTPALTVTSPVFAQNVDLSLYFMLNHHWYFEAAFADEFTKNTVAAGYVGEGYLKHARISNRKIVFPSIYSVSDINRSIGGGNNQAPGMSFNWAGQKWRADAVIRYDMLAAHEKHWYGKNTATINKIALSNFNTGNQYIMPESSLIQKVKDVYVESSTGNYRDSKGRKFKKLDSTQYLLLATQKLVLLSKDAKAARQSGVLPAVAVSFNSPVTQNDFGSYGDETTFLGKIQKFFSSGNAKIDVSKYSYPLFNSIDGQDVVYLQHPSGFSPFALASRYDLGSASSSSDAQIAHSSTGTADTTYDVVIDKDNLSFSEKDFFYPNHIYADISISDDKTSDEVEKLIHAAFPLAKESPYFYLGNVSAKVSDKSLQVRTFSPVNRFEIGTDAVAGTVTVYKNGVIDPTATFNQESGTITLSSAPAASDHITARWYEESKDSESGALAMAGGFKYDFSEKTSGDISLSSRWAYSPSRTYADEKYSSPGFMSLAGSLSYKGERFSAKNTAASSYENTNTTGQYRISGFDESNTVTFYLAKKAGIDLPKDFAPTLNEKGSDSTSHISLKTEKKGSVEATEGKSDSGISGYAIPFEWNFSGIDGGSGENQTWSALTISTTGVSSILANASTFSIALKNPAYGEKFDTENCALYLQLGVSSAKDFSIEEAQKIPTWKISLSSAGQNNQNVKKSFDFSKSAWQTVTVNLSDEDRSIISSLQNFSARLILTTSDTSSLPKTGTIFAGPYEAGEIVFLCQTDSDISSVNYQTKKAQYFEWTFNGTKEESEITYIRYFSEADLSSYKKLTFMMKGENLEKVKVILKRPKSSGEKTALIYSTDNPGQELKKYTVDLTGELNSNLLYLDRDVVPTKLEIQVTTKENGNLTFDELFLSENTPFVVLQDKMEASYKLDGTVLEKKGIQIIKDLTLKGSGNAATSIETENGRSKSQNLNAVGKVGFTLTNLKIGTEISISNAYRNTSSEDKSQKNAIDSAWHSIETEKPLLKFLSLSENYVYSAAEGSLKKANSAKIDFSQYKIPLTLDGQTKASSDSWSLTQNSGAKVNFKPGRLNFDGGAEVNQKIATGSTKTEKFETENYFSSYQKITDFSFDSGDEKAQKRSIKASSSLTYSFDTLKFTPKIYFETEGAYKSSSKVTFTDTTKSGFDIPFAFSKNNFSFGWKKNAGSTDSSSVQQGGSYESDINGLVSALEKKGYFLRALPLYDLASKNLSEEVFESDRESNFYTGSYTFLWKRAFFANKYDFFIPQSAKLEASRDIRTGTSTSDFYQIKNTVTNTALNIFGKSGTLPVFSFFESDEYNSSLSAAIKIPRSSPSSVSYLVSGYLQMTIYITQTNSLKQGFEGSFEGQSDWKAKYTAIWRRNSSSSLAKGLISIFSEKLYGSVGKITKTDSLNASASSSSSSSSSTGSTTKKYSLEFSHATETSVTKYLSLNTEVKAGYSTTWEKIASLSAAASLGATIKF